MTAVACVLVAHIGRTSTQPSTDAIEDRRMCARVLARGSQVREGCASERAVSLSAFAIRRKVVILLDELGFAPSGDARASVIRLHHCPLLEAAHRNPRVVCSVHLGVVRGALDELGADPDRTQSTTLQPFSGASGFSVGLLAVIRGSAATANVRYHGNCHTSVSETQPVLVA